MSWMWLAFLEASETACKEVVSEIPTAETHPIIYLMFCLFGMNSRPQAREGSCQRISQFGIVPTSVSQDWDLPPIA